MTNLNLGAMLRRLRVDHDLTQEQLAQMFDMSLSSYSLYESNKREPSLSFLVKLANYYNVSLDYMTGRVDAEKDFRREKALLEQNAVAAKVMAKAIFLKDNAPEDFKMAMNYFNYVYENARLKAEKAQTAGDRV